MKSGHVKVKRREVHKLLSRSPADYLQPLLLPCLRLSVRVS